MSLNAVDRHTPKKDPYRENEIFLWKSGQKIDRMVPVWVTVFEKSQIMTQSKVIRVTHKMKFHWPIKNAD